MNEKKLKARDFITIGIFTAILWVVQMVIMYLGFLSPFIVAGYTVLIPIVTGIPMMLYYARIEKFGMLTITSVIVAILLFIFGMGFLGAPIRQGVKPMSNTIELAKSFVPKLDECYRLASLTSVLDGAPELAKQGANANELIIPMMSMDGLADYSRNGGYVQGGVTMTNETVKCNFDRGRRFDVDVMDDLETAGLAFGRLSAQFIRDKVVPELDAFRFASYCGISGVTKKEETLADGAATVAALSAAVTAMDDEEVTATGRYLFITPTLLQGINDMDTTKSKKVLEGFEQVIKVPQRRFYTAIKQLSGKTGEEAGGYTKAAGAANINFAIVQKDALIQYTKHAAPKIIAPENNPDADAYVFGYRMVGIAKAYKNMLSGMYFSHDKA